VDAVVSPAPAALVGYIIHYLPSYLATKQ